MTLHHRCRACNRYPSQRQLAVEIGVAFVACLLMLAAMYGLAFWLFS